MITQKVKLFNQNTEKQTNEQTERQTERQTVRQTGRQTDSRQTNNTTILERDKENSAAHQQIEIKQISKNKTI